MTLVDVEDIIREMKARQTALERRVSLLETRQTILDEHHDIAVANDQRTKNRLENVTRRPQEAKRVDKSA